MKTAVLMQLDSCYSFKKNNITEWLIFLLSVEYFCYLMRQMKGPQSVERRESRKHKSKERYFAPWALLCQGMLGSCLLLLPSPQTLGCALSFPRAEAEHKTPSAPSLQWTSLLPCPCWMPANLVLRWSMTPFTCYVQQSQLHHFKLTSIVSFSFSRLTDKMYCSYK